MKYNQKKPFVYFNNELTEAVNSFFSSSKNTYVQKWTHVLFQSTSYNTGLLGIFIYFIFDIILCVLVEFR